MKKNDDSSARYFRTKEVISNRHASHNVQRWEWVDNNGKGRSFSEINKPNSFYRKCIQRPTYVGNESSIRQDLRYDIKQNMIEIRYKD